MTALVPPLPPPNPPPVALPAQPNDPNVPLPAAPVFPPTMNDVLGAVRYRQTVDVSIAERPAAVQCTANDHYNSVLYEHGIVVQAAAAVGPQVCSCRPPWFQGAIQQLCIDLRNDIRNDIRTMLRTDILPDLKRLMNQHRGEGNVVPYEVIPFTNGNDPTQPPYNLPPLGSINAIENLNGHDLAAYLTGYGIVPLPAGENLHATNCLQKETLKGLVGAL
ncbi:hypothetical protein L208DRAFT_1352094 [Tricholoma matsutake]|nr:hypothetical protein L208DRAFT_1352094 [Tricholoma matsutake 945]